MFDIVGQAHMAQGSSTTFVTDLLGNANSALAFNGGYTQVPSGVYFNTPTYAISLWIKPQQVGTWARIIDFGNGSPLDNIVFSQANGASVNPLLTAFVNGAWLTLTPSSLSLVLGEWQFLVGTFDGSKLNVFLNGALISSVSVSYTPAFINRAYNYVGKSNFNDGYSYSFIDDLKFYNKVSNLSILFN